MKPWIIFCLLTGAAVHAQEGGRGGIYQVFLNGVPIEGFGNRVVQGKPFSATEERHFEQLLGDGTKIETNQVTKLYRDGQGRTRVEQADGKASIYDPVAGFRADVDPATRTARRMDSPAPGGAVLRDQLTMVLGRGNTKGVTAETAEKLRSQVVNGVPAEGVRNTLTIARGEIGNDREIKVVTERWTSPDLQMLIKSTNSDPRFGETTYQLINIVEREPDPSLFRIPDGYNVTAPPGRGGGGTRSGGPAQPPSPQPPGGRGKGGKK